MVKDYAETKRTISCLRNRIHRVSSALSELSTCDDHDHGHVSQLISNVVHEIGNADIKRDAEDLKTALSERKRLSDALKPHGLDEL